MANLVMSLSGSPSPNTRLAELISGYLIHRLTQYLSREGWIATIMSKATRKIDSRQLSFEEMLTGCGLYPVPRPPQSSPGSLHCDPTLRDALAAALAACGKDRYQVAMEMSRLTGAEISKPMLDAWTADSKDGHRFPFAYAAAFEVVCGTTALQELLAGLRGSTILVGEDVLLAKLGRIQQLEDQFRLEKQKLKKQLGEKP